MFGDYTSAIDIIKRYEGFNEKAYPDPVSGGAPYTFGYGTQFYPDGSPVKQGQCCTKQKAEEYLKHELKIIDIELDKLDLDLDADMYNALLSFIHSVGWDPFFYSTIIDSIETEDWYGVVENISRWIFDHYYKVIGGLVNRRREEVALFLANLKDECKPLGGILLATFRSYSGEPHEINAILELEKNLNPYVLADFVNKFESNFS